MIRSCIILEKIKYIYMKSIFLGLITLITSCSNINSFDYSIYNGDWKSDNTNFLMNIKNSENEMEVYNYYYYPFESCTLNLNKKQKRYETFLSFENGSFNTNFKIKESNYDSNIKYSLIDLNTIKADIKGTTNLIIYYKKINELK